MRLNTRVINIADINPAFYNPRVDLQPGDSEYDDLKRSIEKYGYVDPIVWNEKTHNIVGGHQRFKILANQGSTEFEVSVVSLNDEEEKALNLALNKISGRWDNVKLAELLQELEQSDIDLDYTGFNKGDLQTLLDDIDAQSLLDGFIDEVEEDDFDSDKAYEDIQEPVTKEGDIWLLGDHKLICGDMTNPETLALLFEDKQADMIFTDPPYNVNYTGKTEDALTIENDHMDGESFYQFLYDAYTNMLTFTKEGGAIYVCHADSEGHNFRTALMDSGWLLKQCIIWVKNVFVISRQDYHWKHEPILYGWKPGAAHQWVGDRKQSTVWEFDKPLRNADHPTMKPVGIPAKAIQNSIRTGQVVFDPFGGSGSTLIAAEQTKRICYTVELDPKYCDVIIKRYEELTGNKAIKKE